MPPFAKPGVPGGGHHGMRQIGRKGGIVQSLMQPQQQNYVSVIDEL